jgi:hypothetical protein
MILLKVRSPIIELPYEPLILNFIYKLAYEKDFLIATLRVPVFLGV